MKEAKNILDELGHSLYHGLDGLRPAQAMAVIQVNRVDSKPLQALCACLLDVFGIISSLSCAVWFSDVGELGSQKDLVALSSPFKPVANEVFIIHICVLLVRLGIAMGGRYLYICLRCPNWSLQAHKLDLIP